MKAKNPTSNSEKITGNLEERNLLERCAPEIARSTAEIIGYDVIITDMQGIIVGASRSERTGSFHEASIEVLRSGCSSYTSSKDAQLLHGTLPGVTWPIQSMNGTTVGTMAIAGQPKSVRPFALIVKKQIEILLREQELFAYSVNRESTIQNLMQDIGSYVPGVGNEAALLARAADLGYEQDRYYVPLAIDLYQFGRYATEMRKEFGVEGGESAETRIQNAKKMVLMEIRKTFNTPNDLSAMASNSRYAVLHGARNSSSKNFNSREVTAEAARLAERLLEQIGRFGLKAAIGIGSPALGLKALSASYKESWRALMLGKKFCQGPGVYDTTRFRLEEMITTIDKHAQNRFIMNVTGTLRNQNDWPDLRETIRQWCLCSFSLVDTSAALHIHRNTLIYRLEKLKRLLGMDLKDFRTCFDLYLALMLDQYSGPTLKEPE